MIRLLRAALVLALPTAAISATPVSTPAEDFSFEDALTICRLGMITDPARGRAMFDALSPEAKPPVLLVCAGYAAGIKDAQEMRGGFV